MVSSKLVLQVLLILCLCSSLARTAGTIRQVFDALNKVRTTPKDYKSFITTNYKDKTTNNIHSEWNLLFNEATPGVFDGAISYLESATAVGKLEIDLGLTVTAYKHAKYQAVTLKGISHTGEGGSSFDKRSSEFAESSNFGGAENVLASSVSQKNGEYYVIDFIIDDGVGSRGHRTNIMNGNYVYTGVGLSTDDKGKQYCTIVFADKNYKCSKCGSVPSDLKEQSGWNSFQNAAGLLPLATALLLAIASLAVM